MRKLLCLLHAIIIAAVFTGCASTNGGGGGGQASKFQAPDGRTIVIGRATPADGGLAYRNPHMDKCWVAEGFNFNGYDTLYIAPTESTAKFQPDETEPHRIARERIPFEIASMVKKHNLFTNVVTSESEVKPGAKVLKLENTITEYAKGGGAARYWVGLYGGGQPILRVAGSMKDGAKEVFKYEARRSGVSGGARMAGVFMTDVDIQSQDIQSMVLDLTDFMAALAGKYQSR